MLGKGLERNARKMPNPFGTIKSMDVVVKVRLRTVATPDEGVAVLLSRFGLLLQNRSNLARNAVEKSGRFFS